MRYKYQILFGAFHPDPSPHLSFLFTFNRPWDTTHYSANTKKFSKGFAPRPPYLSFLFTFKRPGDTNIKYFVELCTQTPHLSFLFTFNKPWDYYTLKHIFQKFSWGFLIYPSCLHSIGQEIQISNSLWGFAPSSPPFSFLFTFNRPWDYYTLKHIYQKFSWGHRPQFHSFILPFYIQ